MSTSTEETSTNPAPPTNCKVGRTATTSNWELVNVTIAVRLTLLVPLSHENAVSADAKPKVVPTSPPVPSKKLLNVSIPNSRERPFTSAEALPENTHTYVLPNDGCPTIA